jgi:hypothetical protein
MASSHYDIPSVFLQALETLLLFESKKTITAAANSAAFEAIKPSLTYGLPGSFWEYFEPLLKGRVTQFIKTCATILRVHPSKLLKEVMPAKEVSRIYLQQSPYDSVECACRAYVSLAEGSFAARCFQPSMPHTNYCTAHQYFRPSIQTRIDQGLPVPKTYERLRSAHDRPELWVDPATGSVYDAALKPAGYYNKDTGKLTLACIKTTT